MDIVSLLLALGHCVHIWWLRGLAFQVVDAILFLNLRVKFAIPFSKSRSFFLSEHDLYDNNFASFFWSL